MYIWSIYWLTAYEVFLLPTKLLRFASLYLGNNHKNIIVKYVFITCLFSNI